jgi:hypothetical protein
MQRKLLGTIKVDFDVMHQLLITYSAFVKEKKWEYNEAGHQLFIDFKKAYDPVRWEVLYNILIEFVIPMKMVRLEEFNDMYSAPSIIWVIKSRRMRWAEHIARTGGRRGVYRVLIGKPEGKRTW